MAQGLFALGHLVVEEVLFGRKVIEDRLVGDAGRLGDLGDGDVVEASGGEQAHRRIGDLASRTLLLVLAQAHALKCTLDYSRRNISAAVCWRGIVGRSSLCSLA